MGFAVFAEVSFVVFLSGFAAVSSALLLGFVCGSWWATRRHRRVSSVAPARPARLSPPRNRARSPQPYSWVPPPEPAPLPSVAGPRRRAKAKAGSPVRGPLPPPLEVPFPPRVAGRWRQVLEGVFYNLDLQDAAASEYRKARALQNQWSSWARYRNVLASHPWERFRGPCGCKGRQPKDQVAPGPSARGRTAF